jgi:hypothetical protein
MNWKGYERKQPWSTEVLSWNFPWVVRKNYKGLIQDNQCPGQDSNQALLKYKPTALLLNQPAQCHSYTKTNINKFTCAFIPAWWNLKLRKLLAKHISAWKITDGFTYIHTTDSRLTRFSLLGFSFWCVEMARSFSETALMFNHNPLINMCHFINPNSQVSGSFCSLSRVFDYLGNSFPIHPR